MQEKIEEAYRVLKLAAEISKTYYVKPLIITYSGGKDSDVLLQLAKECLRPDEFEVLNSHTTVDAPETVYHIREVFKDLENDGIKTTIKMPKYKGKLTNMWNLIVEKKTPPTRVMRYCCQILKESSTPNRIVATGVRADESIGRQGRDAFGIRGATKSKDRFWGTDHVAEVFHEALEAAEVSGKNKNDADVSDCMFITGAKKNKDIITNPIYTWSYGDIWNFIRDRQINVCALYNRGYERVGCVGCPLAGKKERKKEFFDYPKYKDAYIKAFDRMIERRKRDGLKSGLRWETGEEVFLWWIEDENVPGQINIFDWMKDKDQENEKY